MPSGDFSVGAHRRELAAANQFMRWSSQGLGLDEPFLLNLCLYTLQHVSAASKYKQSTLQTAAAAAVQAAIGTVASGDT